jgi:hypothetical protein
MAHLKLRTSAETARGQARGRQHSPAEGHVSSGGTDAGGTGITRSGVAVARLGFWAALMTAGLAAAALALGITTPPRSGSYCRAGCVTYPYVDAAGYVPRDYLWMYPALLSAVAFIALAVCVSFWAGAEWRPLTAVGTCLAVLAGGVLATDYAIQLSVMQVGLRTGETAGLSPLSQYNPRGVFIGLENLGYAVLSLAFVFLGVALVKASPRPARAAGWAFTAGGGVTLVLLVLFSAVYRTRLDSRFEVMALLVSWLVLVLTGALLSITFARARVNRASA